MTSCWSCVIVWSAPRRVTLPIRESRPRRRVANRASASSCSLALALAALVAQEPLDIGDEVAARTAGAARRTWPRAARRRSASSRRARSPCRAARAAREPPSRGSALGSSAPRWLPSARRSSTDGRRVRAGDVVRDLGEVAERRDPRRRRPRARAPRRARTARGARRPDRAETSPRRRPGRRLGSEDRHGPGVGNGRRDRPEADPLGHLERAGELDDVGGERPPAVVGFRADEDQEVAFADADAAHDELVPGQLGQLAVDDLERRATRAIVEEDVGIEPGDHRRVVDQVLERRRRGGPGVDPAVECRDHASAR